MKKQLILFTLSILLISCADIDNIDETNPSINKIIKKSNRNNNYSELLEMDLQRKLQLISFVNAQVLLQNNNARDEVNTLLQNNKSIDFSDLLKNSLNPNYKQEYYKNFEIYIIHDKTPHPLAPSGDPIAINNDGPFGGHSSINQNLSTGNNNLRSFNQEFLTFMDEFHNNCFELYFPLPLVITNEIGENIIAIPHPLSNEPFLQYNYLYAYKINRIIDNKTEYNIYQYYQNILNIRNNNVIVARLKTFDNNCDYEELSPTFDFTQFLNID